MSVHEQGGRGQWSQYSLASGSGAGSSSSATGSSGTAVGSSKPQAQPPTYGGYVPSANPPATADLSVPPSTVTSVTTSSQQSPASPVPSHKSTQDNAPIVTRVRALHTFEPSEAGELAFEKGDIIKVVDRGYKDWWRGQLKGRTGIFPVNYVVRLFLFSCCRYFLEPRIFRNLSPNRPPPSWHGKQSRKPLSSTRLQMSTAS